MTARLRYLGLALAIALLAAAAAALASTGALTYKGCHGDVDSNVDNCPTTAKGLNGADSVAISPGGKSVYVAGYLDSSIARFDRSTTTGFLTSKGCVAQTGDNPDGCTQTAKGLDLPSSVVVSHDGKSVYVTSAQENAIARFNRDTTTGALTAKGCFGDVDNNRDGCAQTAKGLDGASSVAVSNDGKSVYTTSPDDNALDRFARDTTTGALTFKGCVAETGAGNNPDGCGKTAKGLFAAGAVTVSSDGESVYAASPNDNDIVRFDRDTTTGALTAKGCFAEAGSNPDGCGHTAKGLELPYSVVVSPDGESVYVAGAGSNAIARFDRDTTTGALTAQSCVGDVDSNPDACPRTASGLNFDVSLTVSADGASLYAAGSDDDAIARFGRRADTGALHFEDCVGDVNTNPDGCTETAKGLLGVDGVAVSGSGTSVYTVGFDADAVTRFDRQL